MAILLLAEFVRPSLSSVFPLSLDGVNALGYSKYQVFPAPVNWKDGFLHQKHSKYIKSY